MAVDMKGEQVGFLEVVERAEAPPNAGSKRRSGWWRCRCDCGNEIVVCREYLRRQLITHCGCKNQEKNRRKERQPVVEQHPRPFSIPKVDAGKVYGFSITTECKRCGKVFERPHADWGYKIADDFFCTYKCMRAEEREKKGAKER